MKRLRETFAALAERSKEDWDWCGAVTGTKRRGKSSLVYQLAEIVSEVLHSNIWICYYYWEREFEEEEVKADRFHLGIEATNIYPASVQYAMAHSQKGDVIWIDEAVNIVQKHNWNSPECRDFIRKNDVYGWKNLFLFMLQPEFTDFVKGFRTNRLKMHIMVEGRGHALVRIPKETVLGVNWKTATVWTDDFPKLPDSKYQLYQKMKEYLLLKNEGHSDLEDMKEYME